MTTPKKQDKQEQLPAVQADVPSTPMEILARAVASGSSPETLEKLLGLQERWERNQARKAYDAAIAAAKAKFKPITKNQRAGNRDGERSRFGYQYEDLADIERAIIEPLSENGLSYRFRTGFDEKTKLVSVTCIIAHRDGYSEENTLPGPIDTSGSKNAIQAMGSTVTYLQRYTLKAALGLAAERDDDGADGAPVKPAPKTPLKGAEKVDAQTGEVLPPEEHSKVPVAGAPVSPSEQSGAPLSLEDMAREAAKHGKETMRTFWRGRTPAEQKRINLIRPELDALVDQAAQESGR